MNRREFLLAAAGAAAASTLSFSGRLFAAPANTPRFLLVFLRGGYDCNNLLVPTGSDFYYDSRPTLAIAKPDANNPDSAVALDANWGLNPVVRDSLYPLWQKKQLAFIPFAGNLPLSFQGAARDIPNIALKADPKAHFNERQAAILAGMYKGTSLAQAS